MLHIARIQYRKMSSQARLLVTPATALVDDKVDITVERLAPRQPVTLHARLSEGTARFQSYAHYRADDTGRVVVAKQPSLGGLYTGVDQMGLFWSMQPSPGQKPGLRLRKKDVATPFLVGLSVHDGHLDVMEEQNPAALVTTRLERWYLGKGVKRIPLREGRLRGALFLPPGEGPFPGVIDMFGSTGGFADYRSALLASRGFATLGLAFFGYEDLPNDMSDVDLDYFEEAADWLLGHPKVQDHGVGLVGTSKAGEIVLAMATYMKQVSAAVAISSYSAVSYAPLPYKDMVLPCARWMADQIVFTEDRFANAQNQLEDITTEPGIHACIQVEKSHCPIMFVTGEDDMNIPSVFHANKAIARMKAHGKTNYTLLKYPGTGHLIEPPYTPHCGFYFHSAFRVYVYAGGEPKAHTAAQEDSWSKILDFLRKNVDKCETRSKL
ncbi:acyl-coenzyme A amino acid N-acyltransferase 1-like [Branchiostoma floridae x Branchiostoma japonicum]